MSSVVVPALLRLTLARVPVRGVPRLLQFITRRTQRGSDLQSSSDLQGLPSPQSAKSVRPKLCEIHPGTWLDLDLTDSDQCMMFYRLYSRGVLAVARKLLRPGDTVWDIGGQLGYFAGQFARLLGERGRVVTFEPDPLVWPRLLRGLERSGLTTVEARRLAVTAESGEVVLHVSPTAGWSTVVATDEPSVGAVRVPARSIDSMVRQGELDATRLGLVKLDVEGGELGALEGMRTTLHRHPVPVVCEYNAAGLAQAGYAASDLLGYFRELAMTVQAIVEPRGFWRSGVPRLAVVERPQDIPFQLGDLLATPAGVAFG